MDRLTQVTQASVSGGNAIAPKTGTLQYNAASQITDLRRYNTTTVNAANLKVHSRNEYDLTGRIKSITHSKVEIAAGQNWNGTSTVPPSIGAANMLAGYYMVWDRDNRVANFSSYRDAFKTTYTHNTTDELTAATSEVIAGMTLPFPLPTAESYNPDLTGNRRSSTGAAQSANGTQNELQTDGTYNYLYDNEGNITRRTNIATGAVTDYAWDHRNRLASVFERPSASAETTKRTTYVYDVFDRRIGKRLDTTGDGLAERADAWIWDGDQSVMQYRDNDGAGSAQSHRLLDRFLYGVVVDQIYSDEQYAAGTGPLISSTTASATTGNTLWTLTDYLGSVRDVVDNNGVVRQHLVFDSFGKRIREVDYNTSGTVISNTDPAAIDELFAFTGRDWDSDVSLQYNRARWYDAITGRWMSRDPIGFDGFDVNLYRYAGNGPTHGLDPSGLAIKSRLVQVGRGVQDGNPGTYFQYFYYESGFFSPRNTSFGPTIFVPDIIPGIPDLNGLGSQGLKANYGEFAAGVDQCLENTKAGTVAGVIILTVFIPGPEDLLLAVVYSKYGLRIAREGANVVVTRYGKRLSAGELDEVKSILESEATDLKDILNSKSYVVSKNYNSAINDALAWLKARGFNPTRKDTSKWSSCANGMVDETGTIGYRIEYDETIGAHINVFWGKEKGPHFVFPASEADVKKLLRQLF